MPATQHTAQQLAFLQDRISQIGSAIFYNESDAVLKLPTSVVTSLKVDDYGYVWFFVKKPVQDIKEFEPEIPVRLDFFRKGIEYFLQVSGKGWVITDPEVMYAFLELNEDVNANIFNDMVLVKVKMQKVEYYETAGRRVKSNWWQSAMSSVTTMFRSTNHVGPNTFFPAS